MNNLTLLYYTANTIKETTGQKVRDHLLKVTKNEFPIISVSQKPIDFGKNICVGEIGRSKFNCYKQILIGAREVKTKYIAACEDDTLYSPGHFMHRPQEGVFEYETNAWMAEKGTYWRRADLIARIGMFGCLTSTENLLKHLERRFELFPSEELRVKNRIFLWGEPGSHENLYGLENRLSYFESEEPTVVFRYPESMGGLRNGRHEVRKPENLTLDLPPFGPIDKLWNYYWS